MQHFNSTAIRAANYDPTARRLTIWFTNGRQSHDYYGVPADIYQGLLQASSPGQYFNDLIRDQYAA
jgi:hypothetical protein